MPEHADQALEHLRRAESWSAGQTWSEQAKFERDAAQVQATLAIAADFRELVATLAKIQAEGVRAIIGALTPAKTPPAEHEKTLERATSLAERYGEAIVEISKALNAKVLTPKSRILRAQTIIAGLAPESEPEPEARREARMSTSGIMPCGSAGLCMLAMRHRGGADEFCHFPDGHTGPHSWETTLGATDR